MWTKDWEKSFVSFVLFFNDTMKYNLALGSSPEKYML